MKQNLTARIHDSEKLLTLEIMMRRAEGLSHSPLGECAASDPRTSRNAHLLGHMMLPAVPSWDRPVTNGHLGAAWIHFIAILDFNHFEGGCQPLKRDFAFHSSQLFSLTTPNTNL